MWQTYFKEYMGKHVGTSNIDYESVDAMIFKAGWDARDELAIQEKEDSGEL